jgi:hypothetical protein
LSMHQRPSGTDASLRRASWFSSRMTNY